MLPVTPFLVPRSLHVEALAAAGDGLTIRAVSEAADARCPVCGVPAERVHGRYNRTLADLPWAGLAVRVQVQARKFFCDNPACPRTIFAERLAGIAAVRARPPFSSISRGTARSTSCRIAPAAALPPGSGRIPGSR